MKRNCDVAVVGGGPAGLTAAIALASAGVETVLIAKAPPADNRTTALLSGSVAALDARLVVGADGRKSLCRQAAGIETRRQDYPQAALTLNLAHARPHNGVSTEFHTGTGPFTLVPLPGMRCSLVCVLDPDSADELGALDAPALSAEVERRAHSILGKMSVEGGRGMCPLAVETSQ